MTQREQRDPSLRPYRVFMYLLFLAGLCWFGGAMLFSVIDYLW